MSEYTKGPWFVNTVNRDREYPSVKASSIDWECNCCCNCDRVSCSECEANAHLISAAPEMYEELRASNAMLLAVICACREVDDSIKEEVHKRIKCNNKALAKAEGRE